MSILKQAIQSDKEVLIFCRSGKKLTAKVKAFDRHMNMVLENVQELWTEIPKVKSGEKPKVQNKYGHDETLPLPSQNQHIIFPPRFPSTTNNNNTDTHTDSVTSRRCSSAAT